MIDRKEIELLIRSKLQGKGDIESVTKSILELDAAIDKQVAAAKRGEGSIDDLKASMLALKNAQDDLTQRAQLIGHFQRLAKSIEGLEDRVDKSGKRFKEYGDALKNNEQVTEAQTAKLEKLALAYRKSQESLERQKATYEEMGRTLRDAGVDLNNLAESERALRTSAADLGGAMLKTKDAIGSYSEDTRKAKEATRQLADEQAKAKKEAELFAAAEAKSAQAAQRRAAAAQEYEDRQSFRQSKDVSDRRLFEEQADAAKRTANAAEFVRRWAVQLDAADAAEAQLAKNQGLKKTADDAEVLARQYTTLARASTNLRPKVSSLREVIDEIQNPGKAARESLEGLQASAEKLSASIAGIKGPVQDYTGQFKELQNVQKGIASQAGLIDSFKNQAAALRDARVELTNARAKVVEYAAALRQGGEGAQQFVKPLAEAQARVRSASAALQQQVGVVRESRQALADAGINTRQLADAETRLANTARSALDSTKQLTAAVEKYGQATQKPKSLFGGDGERTTLSFVQRLRGEILALAAAYVGLQGAIGLAGGAIDAFNRRQGTQTTIGVGLGTIDRKEIDAEYQYIKQQADRIGVVFSSTAQQYASFAAAALTSGRSRDEVRFIFESFAESARVLNLTEDQLNGVFLALRQTFSLGKLNTEELNQLGERLPAIFEVAQKAVKGTIPDLRKAMQEGTVGAENLIVIAQAYRDMVSGQLGVAVNSLGANQARLTSEIENFKLTIADAGFADAFSDFVKELTVFLRSADGKRLATDIAAGFTAVLNVIKAVVENFETMKIVLGAIAALWAASLIQKQIEGYVALAAAVKGTATALTGLQKAFMLVNAAIVAFAIGTYLYDQFAIVREAGAILVTSYAYAWSKIKFGAMELFEEIPRYAENAFKSLVNFATSGVRSLLTIFAAGARALGQSGLAENIEGALSALTLNLNTTISSRVAQIRKEAEEDQKRIRQIAADMRAEAYAPNTPTSTASSPVTGTPFPGKATTPNKGPSEAEIKKRATEIEAITKALETLTAKIDRTQTDTLSKQLDAIDTEYQALARRIKKLGGDQAVEFLNQLDAATSQLKLQTTRKFNDKLLAEQESIRSKLDAADAAAGRKNKSELDARLKAILDSYAGTYREIGELQTKLEGNGRDTSPAIEARRRLDAAVQELQVLERKKFATEQLTVSEKNLTDTIALRDKAVANVRAQEEAGRITEEQAAAQIDMINNQQIPAINLAAEATRQWALANAQIFANPEAQALFLATLDATAAKATAAQGAFTSLQATMVSTFTGSAMNAIDTIAKAIGGLATGTLKWRDALQLTVGAVANVFAEILKGIAQQIIKQQILNAILAVSKALGWTGIGNAAISMGAKAAPVQHSGGVVGAVANRTRNVMPAIFANAPRYHGGGIPGLASNEYATILKENEEVLSDSDPRNVLNGGLAGKTAAPANIKAVLVDDRRRIPEALNTPEGEQVVLLNIQKNLPTIKQMLAKG